MRFVLDTNIVLYLLGGRLMEPMPAGEHFVSVITELELLSFPSIQSDEERQIRAFLESVQIFDLTMDVKAAAVGFRRTRGLKLPDAIVAGTAHALGATLITNDSRLLETEGLPTATLRVGAP